jgi:hypothetical protein
MMATVKRYARKGADAAWLRMLRVPTREELMRLTDLEVADLYQAKGSHRRVASILMAEMDRRDREDRKRARLDRARAKRQALRSDYDLYVHAAWLKAEADCNGYLLSRAGLAAGIDPAELWSMNTARAMRLASEELIEWWGLHGRWTYTTFKTQARQQRYERAA